MTKRYGARKLGELQDMLHALEASLSGDTVCTWAVGESEQSWLTASPPVTAVPRGASLELSGIARAIESGADSDSYVVAASMGDDVLHVLVPAEIAGLRRERAGSLDLVRRHAPDRDTRCFQIPG